MPDDGNGGGSGVSLLGLAAGVVILAATALSSGIPDFVYFLGVAVILAALGLPQVAGDVLEALIEYLKDRRASDEDDGDSGEGGDEDMGLGSPPPVKQNDD